MGETIAEIANPEPPANLLSHLRNYKDASPGWKVFLRVFYKSVTIWYVHFQGNLKISFNYKRLSALNTPGMGINMKWIFKSPG